MRIEITSPAQFLIFLESGFNDKILTWQCTHCCIRSHHVLVYCFIGPVEDTGLVNHINSTIPTQVYGIRQFMFFL